MSKNLQLKIYVKEEQLRLMDILIAKGTIADSHTDLLKRALLFYLDKTYETERRLKNVVEENVQNAIQVTSLMKQ